MPRAPLHDRGVTSLIVVSGTTSAGVTLRHRSYGLMRQSSTLPLPTVSPLVNGSVPVAVSPGWEEDLPDVISASLALRAWTPTPAARMVHVPVSSHTTAAFPPLGPGRRSTMPVQRLQYGALFRGCSHSLMFRPAGLLATPVAPTDIKHHVAAVASTSEPLTVCYLPVPRIC